MVHRPADSRLLANLLSHEKDYAKQLAALLDSSNASLASFSAYASASAPPASHVILTVAGSLAGADDALRRYATSVDEWREHLHALKGLEDDVGNIMRDREILVTRLLKATKTQKSNRDSLLAASGSSLSLRSDSGPPPKLSAAQAELQACEAHLATAERELEARRSAAVRDGLAVRCRALVECGWVWGEMGKEALRALEPLSSAQNGQDRPGLPHQSSSHHSEVGKPPFDSTRPSSDLSSIAPSQSASQIALVQPDGAPAHSDSTQDTGGSSQPSGASPQHLQIPAAHAISDLALPTSTSAKRHVLARRITEEDLQPEAGSSDEDAGPVEVVENTRFAGQTPTKKRFTLRQGTRSDVGPSSAPPDSAGRGFFGSIKGFFRGHGREPGGDSDREDFTGATTGGSGSGNVGGVRGIFGSTSGGGWETRTDRNLRGMRKTGGSDDDEPHAPPPAHHAAATNGSARNDSTVRGKKLQKGHVRSKSIKGKTRSVSVDAGLDQLPAATAPPAPHVGSDTSDAAAGEGRRKAQAWVGGQGAFAREEADNVERGWTSDGGVQVVGTSGAKVTRKKSTGKAKADGTKTKLASNGGQAPNETQTVLETLITGTQSGLSRNSSLTSSASAPIAGARRKVRNARSDSVPPIPISGEPRRATSMNGDARRTTNSEHRRAASVDGSMGEGSTSLMSIVEDVARQNRRSSTGAGMTVVRAPPVLTRRELNALMAEPAGQPNGRAAGGSGGVTLEIVKAPPSITRRDLTAEPQEMRNGRLPEKPNGISAGGLLHANDARVGRPAKSPLRSALRSSRTPSPLPPLPLPVLSLPSAAAYTNRAEAVEAVDTVDDKASISSYETGHETFDGGDDTEHEPDHPSHSDPPPPPPPPHDYPSSSATPMHKADSDVSASTASTELATTAAAPPQRRKSVRVSLQPTFSPTPPALDDADDAPAGGPWGGNDAGWETRVGGRVRDMWEDSSDEDAEYARAKRLLTRAARKQKSGAVHR